MAVLEKELLSPLMAYCPVESISGVWKFEREPYRHSHCRSLPGHLLHLVEIGEYTLVSNGRKYHIKAGDVIYYYESEDVEWHGGSSWVNFYSIGFNSSLFPSFPFEKRIFSGCGNLQDSFEKIYRLSVSPELLENSMEMHAELLKILIKLKGFVPEKQENNSREHAENLWWKIERLVRGKKLFRAGIPMLSKLSGFSPATINRACHDTVNTSPGNRLRELRMEEARGLLKFSEMNITQIAAYLGYPRIHEFSREYSKYFGYPPSEERLKR
jgi:AraC-like DNA-binding protein